MSESRNLLLDGVRGLAILVVVLIHNFSFHPSSDVWQAVNAVLSSGWIGVDLFFVLSGYLITGILVRAKHSEHYFRNFYIRRSLRIFPAYYAYLLLIFWALALVQGTRPPPEHVWFYAYLQNISVASEGRWLSWPGVAHLWSVAVEEQFYLLWPLCVAFLAPRALLRLAISLIATAWLIKLLMTAAGSWWFAIYTLPWTRMDGLAAGALIALLPHCGIAPQRLMRAARTGFWFALLTLLLIALRQRTLGFYDDAPVAAYTMLATLLCSCGFFLTLQSRDRSLARRFFGSSALRFLGKYSYGLYLLHYGVAKLTRPAVQDMFDTVLHGQAARLAAGIAVSLLGIALAMLMYHVLEEPLLRLKDRFTLPGTQTPAQ